jgi:hypothetical protein
MERQNVTLSLPKPLLKKAKALAASMEKSLSVLLRESLEEKVDSASGFSKARERQVKLLRKGFDLGSKGRLTVSREELHDR